MTKLRSPLSPVIGFRFMWPGPSWSATVRPSSARQRRLFLPSGDCTFTFFPCYEKLILVNKTFPNIGLLTTIYENIKEKMVPIFFICPILLGKFNLHTYQSFGFSVSRPLFFTLSVEICPPKCHQGGAVAGEVEVPTRGQRQVPGPGFTARLGQGLGSCRASQN